EVGYRSGRCNHLRELVDGPLYHVTMLRLVASPLPGRALAVVHEPKEPLRGRHSCDATRAAAGAALPRSSHTDDPRGRAPAGRGTSGSAPGVAERIGVGVRG